jgi:riboflavin kinase/FMN adenylyltransferase
VHSLVRRRFHCLSELPLGWPGCVATVGVFDGLHRGHQALVDRACELAAAFGVPSVLVTFHPHPLEVLKPGGGPRLLTDIGERVRLALDAGIDAVFVQHFDEVLAQRPAEAWAADFLGAGLRARAVVVGEDFRFGARNLGDAATLRTVGAHHGFTTDLVPLVRSRGDRCSSTRVRELVAAGRTAEVRDLLGRTPGA